MTLREASWRDAWRLRRWRNDPTTYRYFLTPRPAGLIEHLSWLRRAFRSSDTRLFIGESSGQPVGMVRLDLVLLDDVWCWEVSITIAPTLRGRGYGRQLLHLIAEIQPYPLLHARIHRENYPSLAIFYGEGFRFHGFIASDWIACVKPCL